MTRHQRRRAANARKAAKMVARNLSAPMVRERSSGLVSGVYRGEQDRARGMGVTPGGLVQPRRATEILGSERAGLLFSTQNDRKGAWNRCNSERLIALRDRLLRS